MLQVCQDMAAHSDDDQELGRNEELRLICTECTQANEAAEQGELRKADRAGGGSDERTGAAQFIEMRFHTHGGLRRRFDLPLRGEAAPDEMIDGEEAGPAAEQHQV